MCHNGKLLRSRQMPIEGGGIAMATGDAATSAPIAMGSWRDMVPMGVGEEGGARE
jgi:hypothetical protein